MIESYKDTFLGTISHPTFTWHPGSPCSKLKSLQGQVDVTAGGVTQVRTRARRPHDGSPHGPIHLSAPADCHSAGSWIPPYY